MAENQVATESPYVAAIGGLIFRGETLKIGDPFPVEPGRNYSRMLHLGQIKERPLAEALGEVSAPEPPKRGPGRPKKNAEPKAEN